VSSTFSARRLGRRTWLGVAAAFAAAGSGPLACGIGARDSSSPLRIWAHQGQEAENAALRAVVAAFANAQGGLHVELSCFPDHHYGERLSIAAAASDMPDVFELDGPFVTRFVDAGLLAPLDGFFSQTTLGDFLPSVVAQGTLGGRLYALGAFDSAMVLYFDRDQLERAHVQVPPDAVGFSWPELLDACARLNARGVRPISLHMGESADEWYTYAFSPLLWSAGGRLIDASGTRVAGVLSSSENVSSLRAWQILFERGYANNAPVDPDPFGHGAVAMDWSGHWMARSHLAHKGSQLGAMKLPRMGPIDASPCGSYCWCLFSGSRRPELAAKWIGWVTGTATGVLPIVTANGAVPARRSAFPAFPEYEKPPYALFRALLEQGARPRPRTPFYAILTREFAAALRDIARGAAVRPRLVRAEEHVRLAIDRRSGMARGGAR
jgi:multiple sugar transport system substrate-binding protein